MLFFFFCKQKTAYEMRISDWSSDVCSSDLPVVQRGQHVARAGGLFGLALDLDAIAARRNINPQAIFQRDQILVEFAEQLSKQLRLVEQYLKPGAFAVFRLLGFSRH